MSSEVSAVLDGMNRAWLENRPLDLRPFLDERIVMIVPGFAGRIEGREPLVQSFVEYCQSARTLEFQETDRQIDVLGPAAVASIAFRMVYEREGGKYRSTGRDLWVFAKKDDRWLAVWRTMLDVTEEPA